MPLLCQVIGCLLYAQWSSLGVLLVCCPFERKVRRAPVPTYHLTQSSPKKWWEESTALEKVYGDMPREVGNANLSREPAPYFLLHSMIVSSGKLALPSPLISYQQHFSLCDPQSSLHPSQPFSRFLPKINLSMKQEILHILQQEILGMTFLKLCLISAKHQNPLVVKKMQNKVAQSSSSQREHACRSTLLHLQWISPLDCCGKLWCGTKMSDASKTKPKSFNHYNLVALLSFRVGVEEKRVIWWWLECKYEERK